jgi:putative acetyltransferase
LASIIRGKKLLVIIREERPEDIDTIRVVNQKAFGQPQEGTIVDALRKNNGVLLSLVATINNSVVGHILYSPVSIETDGKTCNGAGLGPMAVLPEHQRHGIGSKMVDAGNQKLKEAGCPFIVVVGHPEFYTRFGFKTASRYGIQCEWDVPDNVFMVLIIDQANMEKISGLAKYREEFSTVE